MRADRRRWPRPPSLITEERHYFVCRLFRFLRHLSPIAGMHFRRVRKQTSAALSKARSTMERQHADFNPIGDGLDAILAMERSRKLPLMIRALTDKIPSDGRRYSVTRVMKHRHCARRRAYFISARHASGTWHHAIEARRQRFTAVSRFPRRRVSSSRLWQLSAR